MCTATLAIAAVSGVGTAIADRQAKMSQWRAQKAAVDRSNAMAKMQYQNQIQISAFKDQQKLNVFEAQLDAQAQARQNLTKQVEINQQEATRASLSNQLKLNEKVTEAAFEGQQKLAASIQAQGTVLASGMQAGQSMMLAMQDIERQLGFEQAAVNASLFNANQSFAMSEYGNRLSQYAADSRAVNALPAGPLFAPVAEFQTVRPIEQAAPEKPSMLGSIMAGVSAGVSVGHGIGHADPNKQWWQGPTKTNTFQNRVSGT
tara:strand:- start:728 stop:1507 length:780 start_codon:yes stop_codon:yes gene_type:complete